MLAEASASVVNTPADAAAEEADQLADLLLPARLNRLLARLLLLQAVLGDGVLLEHLDRARHGADLVGVVAGGHLDGRGRRRRASSWRWSCR